ncbi:MAG: HlyD family secretion protein [Cyanobacteriota bacterium]|nr:HlyD family secretion protein [Cyanobacteriota bacterium]
MTTEKVFDSSDRTDVTSRLSERVILLKRPVLWSYIFASLIVGAGIAVGTWAAIARFEQTVLATGTLEQQNAAKEIKAPTNGVVQEIRVKDGEAVQKNQPLATLQATASPAEVESLTKEKQTLTQQNQLYESILQGKNPVIESDAPSLTKLRAELVKENQYYQALVTNKERESQVSGEFNANQQRLLAASSPQLQSRASAARLQIQDLEKRSSKVQEKLAAARKLLAENPDALEQLTQVSKQVQAEVKQLSAQQQQLAPELSKAKEELQNTIILSKSNVLAKVAQNQKQISDIDSQLKQAQLQNQKRIAEIDAQLIQPQYLQLTSPVEGVVFDVQPPAPGTVANANQTLLSVVPNDSVVVSVFLNDKDTGVVKEGMDVDVRMASFPKSELGSLKAKVVWVGSDVLPPAPGRAYYAIPARIQLKRPFLEVNGKLIRLQPGMAVNCEIILPQKRTVLDVVRHTFEKKAKSAVELVR